MWATRYAGWPAQRKLEYMDRLMRELAHRTAASSSRKRVVDPLPRLQQDARRALPQEARALRPRSPGLLRQRPAQPVLRRAGSMRRTRRRPASSGEIRKEVRSTVASFTDSYQYTIDQLLEKIIERCRELNLRLDRLRRSHQNRLHGFPHRADDELPAQRPAPGGAVSASKLRVAGARPPPSHPAGRRSRRAPTSRRRRGARNTTSSRR